MAVLVDFENDVISKIEHNLPKHTFSSIGIISFTENLQLTVFPTKQAQKALLYL